MSKREKLSDAAIVAFVTSHLGWERQGDALVKTFEFADYPGGLAFAVRVGFAAERRDHHPDLRVSYRKVEVTWSTHDQGGITAVDIEMAELCDQLHHA